MRWTETSAETKMELLIDENGRTLGRVRLQGERWVALGASKNRAIVIGYYSTIADARLALERSVLGAMQAKLDDAEKRAPLAVIV